MPRTFEISMPTVQQREGILKLILDGTPCDASLDFAALARVTGGYSGSDLKELCRAAAMAPVRDFMKTYREPAADAATKGADGVNEDTEAEKEKLRPLSMRDLQIAMQSVLPTGETASAYQQQEQQAEPGNGSAEVNMALREVICLNISSFTFRISFMLTYLSLCLSSCVRMTDFTGCDGSW
jgi:SpoVK/Ycf46/Vps4 family AAA+-type ATPase